MTTSQVHPRVTSEIANQIRRYLKSGDDSYRGVTCKVIKGTIVIDNLNNLNAFDIAKAACPTENFEAMSPSMIKVISREENADDVHYAHYKKYRSWQKAGREGTMPDEQNPAYLFSTTHLELLSQIAKGQVDAQWMAKKELANRGYSLDGKWIGFDQALINNFNK